jgi:hypothetical protein
MYLLQNKIYLPELPAFKPFILITHILLSASIILVQCTKPVPDASQKECEEWFVSPAGTFNKSVFQLQPEDVAGMLGKARRYGEMQSRHNSVTLFDTTGTEFICGFYSPAIVEKDKRYPLVIYLHGGTGTTINTKGERAYEMLKPLADSMPLFLASPSASRSSQWWTPTGISRIFQTLRYMSLYYPIDPSKVFLAGVSDGASGCYALANVAASPFAGFFAISGYGGIIASTGMKVQIENIRQRPIYNVNAGMDRLYSLDIINEFLDYMENGGAQIVRKTYPQEQHGFDYRDREYDTLLTMIRSWSRETFKGNLWNFVQGYPNMAPFCLDWEYASGQTQASVATYFSADTLMIRSNGLQKFTIRTEQLSVKFVKFNGLKIAPDFIKGKLLARQKISYLKYSCFPMLTENDFIRVIQK